MHISVILYTVLLNHALSFGTPYHSARLIAHYPLAYSWYVRTHGVQCCMYALINHALFVTHVGMDNPVCTVLLNRVLSLAYVGMCNTVYTMLLNHALLLGKACSYWHV